LREAWLPYFRAAGLDLTGAESEDLLSRLKQPVEINRSLPGLKELAPDAKRGIEASNPAQSLFYHVLASPDVTPEWIADEDYPTTADLNVVENCIYSSAELDAGDLLKIAHGASLAIGVFTYEYAPAAETIHRLHADMCFSRTGIARIGNSEPYYVAKARGFFPDSGKLGAVHVVPARYGAFVAARLPGSPETFGPLNHCPADRKRSFWVPLHKLFPGGECIRGINVQLDFESFHVNEKIMKVHLALQAEGVDTGWNAAQMQEFPFVIQKGLAGFCQETGLLTPVPHEPMIEPARTAAGKLVGFRVPPSHKTLWSALWFEDKLNARSSPEFVHAKHAITTDSQGVEHVTYLPDTLTEEIHKVVKEGGYTAANFIDWTADGWIKVGCPSLTRHIHRHLSAYSVLAQPDFFPLVRQEDLARWWEHTVPRELRGYIWPDRGIVPTSLSGARLPANMTLHKSNFDSADHTLTAIVGAHRKSVGERRFSGEPPMRESTLSYRASNLFEPGWDTSRDFGRDSRSRQGTFFLSNYGLGSPFAEDTLICAAYGGYWPGAVPDTTRFFPPHTYPSTTPLPDGYAGWDGMALPKLTNRIVTYDSFEYADYVEAIWKGKLQYDRFARIKFDDYCSRTQAMARVFQFRGIQKPAQRAKIAVLSFRAPTRPEFANLKEQGWKSPRKKTYRFELATFKGIPKPSVNNPTQTKAELNGPLQVLFASEGGVAAPPQGKRRWWIVEQF
jgi:hypothetical protein